MIYSNLNVSKLIDDCNKLITHYNQSHNKSIQFCIENFPSFVYYGKLIIDKFECDYKKTNSDHIYNWSWKCKYTDKYNYVDDPKYYIDLVLNNEDNLIFKKDIDIDTVDEFLKYKFYQYIILLEYENIWNYIVEEKNNSLYLEFNTYKTISLEDIFKQKWREGLMVVNRIELLIKKLEKIEDNDIKVMLNQDEYNLIYGN